MRILYEADAGGGAGGGGSGNGGTGSGAGGTGVGTSGGGGTGTPPDWRASIPEELRNEPMLKDIKDVHSLAKGYVAAQRMVGTDKIAKPQEKWTDTDWTNFYNGIGRPQSPDKYSFKPEGLPESIKIDDAKLGEAKKALHSAGLTDKQASSVMKYYLDTLVKDTQAYMTSQTQTQEKTMQALTTEFGDATKVKIDIAKSVVQKFGGDTLVTLFEQTGLGNNAEFIKMFAKIGEAILDDKAIGGSDGAFLPGPAQAQAEIKSLKGDSDFQAKLTNRQNPGHKEALQKWSDLHKAAYPPEK